MNGKGPGRRAVWPRIVLVNLCGLVEALAIEAVLLSLGLLHEADVPYMVASALVFLLIVDIGWYVRGAW